MGCLYNWLAQLFQSPDKVWGTLSPPPRPPPPLAAWRSSTQILRPHSKILEQTLSIRNKQNKLFPFPQRNVLKPFLLFNMDAI